MKSKIKEVVGATLTIIGLVAAFVCGLNDLTVWGGMPTVGAALAAYFSIICWTLTERRKAPRFREFAKNAVTVACLWGAALLYVALASADDLIAYMLRNSPDGKDYSEILANGFYHLALGHAVLGLGVAIRILWWFERQRRSGEED